MEKVTICACLLGTVCCLSSLSTAEGMKIDDRFEVENGLDGLGRNLTYRLESIVADKAKFRFIVGIGKRQYDYIKHENFNGYTMLFFESSALKSKLAPQKIR
ncbi:hypothetical protein FACS1894122_05940 [Alphaproteobacteria bacterium]|nr:hypothetical protein FACS1894122_05940 [Alphaproteobacteria bacterium]